MANEEVLKEAVLRPPAVVTLTGLPVGLPSTTNCTVPLGVPMPGAATLTVAVKLTFWPDTEGLTEELTSVVVLALATVCIKLLAVLVLKLLSPL
jgi:hypothetical protein